MNSTTISKRPERRNSELSEVGQVICWGRLPADHRAHIKRVIDRWSGFTQAEKRVYLAISGLCEKSYQNFDHNRCIAFLKTLADMLDLSTKTVQRAVHSLVARGLLRYHERRGTRKGWLATLWMPEFIPTHSCSPRTKPIAKENVLSKPTKCPVAYKETISPIEPADYSSACSALGQSLAQIGKFVDAAACKQILKRTRALTPGATDAEITVVAVGIAQTEHYDRLAPFLISVVPSRVQTLWLEQAHQKGLQALHSEPPWEPEVDNDRQAQLDQESLADPVVPEEVKAVIRGRHSHSEDGLPPSPCQVLPETLSSVVQGHEHGGGGVASGGVERLTVPPSEAQELPSGTASGKLDKNYENVPVRLPADLLVTAEFDSVSLHHSGMSATGTARSGSQSPQVGKHVVFGCKPVLSSLKTSYCRGPLADLEDSVDT